MWLATLAGFEVLERRGGGVVHREGSGEGGLS